MKTARRSKDSKDKTIAEPKGHKGLSCLYGLLCPIKKCGDFHKIWKYIVWKNNVKHFESCSPKAIIQTSLVATAKLLIRTISLHCMSVFFSLPFYLCPLSWFWSCCYELSLILFLIWKNVPPEAILSCLTSVINTDGHEPVGLILKYNYQPSQCLCLLWTLTRKKLWWLPSPSVTLNQVTF